MKVLAAVALIGLSLPAQTCFYNWTSDPVGGTGSFPDLFEAAISGPLSQPVQRHHILVPGVAFQNVPARITEMSIGVAAGMRVLRFEELTIRMSQTTATSLSSTFATNVTSPQQTVLLIRDHIWQQGFGPEWIAFGLQQPFQFVPGNGNLL